MNTSTYSFSLDGVNEGIAVFRYADEQTDSARLEYANQALCNMLHFSLAQLKGADYAAVLEAVHPDDVDKLWSMIRSLPQTKTGNCTYRFKYFKTGEMKWLTAHGQYLRDENGYMACYAYSDISAHIDAVERERRLVKCIRLITDETDFKANIEEMMHCLRAQYKADRAYIFEFEWDKNIMHNRVEVTAENVMPEIDELQDLPVDIVSHWLPKFKAGSAVFIEDLEKIRDIPGRKDEYDVLAMQDIVSLMVVPISKSGELYGYVGVDNPHQHFGDKEFLSSIAAILAQEYQNRLQKEMLTELSLQDPLTKINNRHAYNKRVERLAAHSAASIGVVFTDVNGLKYINDQYGHREGDALIMRAVDVLEKYFRREDLYRISGDEFVVMVENIPEDFFSARIEKMKMDVSTQYGAIFSIGQTWQRNTTGIEKVVRYAEKLMYEDKKSFYARFPEKGRRKSDMEVFIDSAKGSDTKGEQ